MQKLVTVYLDNMAYAKGKMIVGSFADKHGLVEEHLQDDLQNGWTVKAIHGFGGNSDAVNAKGWVVVLLEKKAGLLRMVHSLVDLVAVGLFPLTWPGLMG
jgi:hypothetical protein